MQIRTLTEIPELKGKKVILRVDFNVPLSKENQVEDDTRIQESLPTINHLLAHGAKVIIITHLGRPDGKIDEKLRLEPVVKKLQDLVDANIHYSKEILGENVKNAVNKLGEGEILILENIRFMPEEESNDQEFSQYLASLGDIYVNDAFATAHRAHASTAGIAKYLPSYGGLLMEKEVTSLSPLVNGEMPKPVTMVIGGAKIDTKLGILKNFINKVDYFLLGGGLANTFLHAAGYNVAKSLYEDDKKELAQEIMTSCEKAEEHFILPHDVVVADTVSDDTETANLPVEDVMGDMKILDIGKWTAEKYGNIIQKSGTVIWNGPLGVCELKKFQAGTASVGNALVEHQCNSIIGGGDTIDAFNRIGIDLSKFTHVSTGGGACIEFLEGKILPGIEAISK